MTLPKKPKMTGQQCFQISYPRGINAIIILLVLWKLSLSRHSVHYQESLAKEIFESLSHYQRMILLVNPKVTHKLKSNSPSTVI